MRYDDTDQAKRYDGARAMPREDQVRYLAPLRPHLPKPVRLVVDLGCGTGRFSAALADEFSAPVLGVDPARTMLAKARENVSHPRVTFVQGESGAIPLPDRAADLVFVSMAWHHFEDQPAAARDMRRVLPPGGVVAMRNTMADALDGFAFLEYFPAARSIGDTTLPRRDHFTAVMRSAGFTPLLHQVVGHEMAPTWGAYCDKIAARAYSLLARISDREFEAGIAAMRRVAGPQGPIVEPIDFFVFRA